MKDNRIEKIRAKIERLKSQLIRGACASQIAMETRCKEEAYNEVLAILDSSQEEPVSEDLEKIVEEIAEPTILNAYGTKELARRLLNTIYGTSISDDLGEYINELSKQFPEVSFAKLSRIAVRVAKWQRQQDNNDANHALVEQIKTQQMCYEKGMADMKRQMMAKAIDGKVIANGMGNPILHLWDKGKHLIDKKVKVILIKED